MIDPNGLGSDPVSGRAHRGALKDPSPPSKPSRQDAQSGGDKGMLFDTSVLREHDQLIKLVAPELSSKGEEYTSLFGRLWARGKRWAPGGGASPSEERDP